MVENNFSNDQQSGQRNGSFISLIKFFSHESYAGSAAKACLDTAVGTFTCAPSDFSEHASTVGNLVTPPPSVDIPSSLEERFSNNTLHWRPIDDKLVAYQPFNPSKASFCQNYSSSPLTSKRQSPTRFSPAKKNGRKSNWIRKTLRSAGHKVSKKLRARRGEYSLSELKNFENDADNEEETRQDEEGEDEGGEEYNNDYSISFAFGDSKKIISDKEHLKEPFNEEFNIFENNYYFNYNVPNYYDTDLTTKSIFKIKNDQPAEEFVLNKPSLALPIENCDNKKENDSDDDSDDDDDDDDDKQKQVNANIKNEKSARRPIVDQLSFAVDENIGHTDKDDISKEKSNIEKDISLKSSQCEYNQNSIALMKELNSLIDDAKPVMNSQQLLSDISTTEYFSEEKPLNFDDKIEFSFNSIDKNSSRKNVVDIRGKQNREKCLLTQFINNFIENNKIISNYCKLGLVFLSKHPTSFDECNEALFFQPNHYDLDGPCFFKDLQKLFLKESDVSEKGNTDKGKQMKEEELEISESFNGKENMSELDEEYSEEFTSVKQVKFLSEKDYEIQEFATTDIPAITTRSKNLQKSLEEIDSCKIKNILNTNNVSFSDQFSLENKAKGESNGNFNPKDDWGNNIENIGFPDLATKNLVNGLLELLGAPEEVKKSDDLKLSLMCLHPCFAKVLGFLWNVNKIVMTELEYVKKYYREARKKIASNEVEIQTIHEQFKSIKTIHNQKVKELEKKIEDMRDEQAYLRAYNNAKVAKIDMEISVTNEKIGKFFEYETYSDWKKRTNEKLNEVMRYFERQTKFVIEAKQTLLETLTELEAVKELDLEKKNYFEKYKIVESKYEEYRSAENVFNKLSHSLYKKNKKINKLNDKIQFLEAKLETKDAKINAINKTNKEKVEELVEMSIEDRRRSLGLWEKTRYESAMMENEDLLDQLRYQLSLKEESLSIKENELYNMDVRFKDSERINSEIKFENQMLKFQLVDDKKYYEDKYERMRRKYLSEIIELKDKLEKKAKWFTREILINKKNCQLSVEEALKVALKAELSSSAFSSSKRLAATKAISYIMNKKRNLQKCFDTLQIESIPMNDKYMTWENLPKCDSYRVSKKKQSNTDFISIKNPNHFNANPGWHQDNLDCDDKNNVVEVGSSKLKRKNFKDSEDIFLEHDKKVNYKDCLLNSFNSKTKIISNENTDSKFSIAKSKPSIYKEVVRENDNDENNEVLSRLNDFEHYNETQINNKEIFDMQISHVKQNNELLQNRFDDENNKHVIYEGGKSPYNDSLLVNVQTSSRREISQNNSIDLFNGEKKMTNYEQRRLTSCSCTPPSSSMNSIFNEPIRSYGKSSGARFVRERLRSASFPIDKLNSSNISLDTTKIVKTPFEQFGENINGIISSVASTFKRKISSDDDDDEDEDEDEGDDNNNVDRIDNHYDKDANDDQSSINNIEGEEGTKFNENQRSDCKMKSLTPLPTSLQQNTIGTPLTSNTTAPLTTRSSWFEFSNKDLSWHSFKFSTARENC